MNYTEKYHLPQWEEQDRVMRTDFNSAMAGIAAGIAEAKSVADEGLEKANTLPYKVGRYYGTAKTQNIELGFRPSFIIISGTIGGHGAGALSDCYLYGCQTAGYNMPSSIQFTDTGFTVSLGPDVNYFPRLSAENRPYEYIAFK